MRYITPAVSIDVPVIVTTQLLVTITTMLVIDPKIPEVPFAGALGIIPK
jgi:hypothetical protein